MSRSWFSRRGRAGAGSGDTVATGDDGRAMFPCGEPRRVRTRPSGVLGSAGELACEIAAVARSVSLAARSGSWVVPRLWGRVPVDWFDTRVGCYLPIDVRRSIFSVIFRLAAGPRQGTGLPAPDRRLGDKP